MGTNGLGWLLHPNYSLNSVIFSFDASRGIKNHHVKNASKFLSGTIPVAFFQALI